MNDFKKGRDFFRFEKNQPSRKNVNSVEMNEVQPRSRGRDRRREDDDDAQCEQPIEFSVVKHVCFGSSS